MKKLSRESMRTVILIALLITEIVMWFLVNGQSSGVLR